MSPAEKIGEMIISAFSEDRRVRAESRRLRERLHALRVEIIEVEQKIQSLTGTTCYAETLNEIYANLKKESGDGS